MVPQEVYERMEVCLHEAVLNAIVHGNKEQETRIVEVVLGWQDSTWTLEVRDEGSGFDPNAVVDPTAQENLLRTHGRGLYLMRELSDGIWFTDHARTVRMSFRPRNPPPSI